MAENNLPDFMKLWDFSNPAETEKKFRELEPEIKKSRDTGYYIELLTQIARTQGLQRNFDEAHKTLDKAMKMIGPKHIRPRIRYMLERGRAYNSAKVFDKARELFLAAYQQGAKYGEDEYTIDAAHMMGIVEKGDESLRWNEIAVKHAEETKDEHAKGWLGPLYNNIGWTYHGMENYEKALELFQKNLEYYNKRDSKKWQSITRWCVARALRSLGRTDEALQKQYELKKFLEEKQMDSDGYNNEEIGECLYALGREDEAKPYFAKAYETLSKDIWLAANEKERLERLKKLGE